MTSLKSNHDAPLPLPGVGGILNPGATRKVDKWNVLRHNDTIKAWISAGLVEVIDDKPAPALAAKPITKVKD